MSFKQGDGHFRKPAVVTVIERFHFLRRLPTHGLATLIVEPSLEIALSCMCRTCALVHGRIVHEGAGETLANRGEFQKLCFASAPEQASSGRVRSCFIPAPSRHRPRASARS